MLLLAAAIAAAALALFAQLTGWAALVRRYRLVGEPAGRGSRTGGVVVGPWGWNAPPLRVSLDEMGFALAPTLPFRFFFHTVRVPWDAVATIERRENLLFDIVRIECRDDSVIGFLPSQVTSAIADRLMDKFQQSKT
jgi:hypothetical protein